MDQNSGSRSVTPIKSDAESSKKDRTQKHIQVNLSKEYFATFLNQEDNGSSTDGRAETSPHDAALAKPFSSDDTSKPSDNESGITPFAHDVSPIRGIMKNMTEMCEDNNKLFEYEGSPKFSHNSPGTLKSPKKVRIKEPHSDTKFTSMQAFTEMEGLRAQLRNMIELTQIENSSKKPQPDHKENPGDRNQAFAKARRSFEDFGQFKGMLSYTSPTLEMDENGIMRGMEPSRLSSMGITSSDYTSPPTDRSLLFENSLLKESLEREKQRRKHCEDQIQNSQKKVLEVQQQLAIANATDKKKAIMIGQLDKTLANIVAGWKRQDSQRARLNQNLKEENKGLRKSQNKQQELLEQFEKELAHAVESLTREQRKTKTAEQEKEDQMKVHEEQRVEALEKLQREQGVSNRLREDLERLGKDKDELNKKLNNIESEIDEDRRVLVEERNELSEEANRTKDRLLEEIEQLQHSLETSKNESQETNMKAMSLQHEVENARTELDAVMREKEALKIELALLEAKIETLKVKHESEARELLEEEFNKRINIIQDEIMRTEDSLKTAHKEQMLQLNQKHKEDLELQLKRFHEELNKRENQTLKMKGDFERRLLDAQNETLVLRDTKAKLEMQRKELTRRLQSLMQQHIQEAVSLLSVENGGQTPRHKQEQMLRALNYQIQTANNESISEVHKDNLNPLSSTFTDPRDFSGTKNSSVIYPELQSSVDSKTRMPENARGQNTASSLLDRGRESVQDVWKRLSEMQTDDETTPLERQDLRIEQLTPAQSVDSSVMLRERQFQAGLQDLSEKLRRNDLYITTGQEMLLTADGGMQRSWKEDAKPGLNQWEEIQQLLKSKLDEVKQNEILAEDIQNEKELKEAKQNEYNARTDDEAMEQDYRQAALTSFVKKLLNRSPGNPTEEDVDYEQSLLDESKAHDVVNQSRTCASDRRATSKSKHEEYLPIGSDSVSKDSVEGNLKTPPKAHRTSTLAPAFKKSVLRERNANPTFGHDTEQEQDLANSLQRPQKLPGDHSEGTNDARKQLMSLMKALGIKDDKSMKNLGEIVGKMSATDLGRQSQDKRRLRSTVNQSNPNKTLRAATSGVPNRAQPQPQPQTQPQLRAKSKQKMPDDVFSRLQKVYGNTEKGHQDQFADEQNGRTSGSKHLPASKNQSYQSSKHTNARLKEQRKTQATSRPLINAWK